MWTPSAPGAPRARSARAVRFATLTILLSLLTTGCGHKGGGVAPAPWSGVGIGSADETVLTGSAAWFAAQRAQHGAGAARLALLDTLGGWPGVAHAELARDGTTIALHFSDGHVGAVNTAPELTPGAAYDPTGMRTAFLGGAPFPRQRPTAYEWVRGRSASPARRAAGTPAVWRSRQPGASRIEINRLAPHARKVLLLDAAAGGYSFDEDTALLDYMASYLVTERGWAAADIVMKANRIADSYGTLDFEDFFRLKDYGLIVIVARSLDWDMPSDPDNWSSPRVRHYWVQVADANGYNYRHDPAHGGGGAERIDVQAELARGRIVEASETPTVGGTPVCFYMRDDLWQEQMNGNLPGSVVVLLSPHGYLAQPVFGFRQASSFSSWTDSLSTQVALDAAWLPLFMAQGNDADVAAAMNGVLPQSFGTSQFQVWPGAPVSVYLPTWADVSTASAPAGTQTVRVSATYTSAMVMAPDQSPIEDVPGAVKNFSGMVPDQPLRFLAQALNASGTVLAEAHVDTTLRTGNNDIAVAFTPQPSGISLETSTLLVDTRNPADVTLTAAVRNEQGQPIQGRLVQFSRVAAIGSIVGTNPATTNASGIASVVVHTDYIPPSGIITINMIARDLTTQKADTVAVKYCDQGKFIVWLAGTADLDQFWQVPGGDIAVSGVDLRLSINGTGPYGIASMTGPTTHSFVLSGYYSSGDVLKFHVRPLAIGVAGSIGPLYVHVYNCLTHEVNAAGTVAAPTSGENTFTVTVP